MAKALFRFLRGELNGFYITSLYNTLNETSKEIKEMLTKFSLMQFNKDMPEEYIYGIGKFAGVYLLRFTKSETTSSFRLSESDVVDGVEQSEKGLYNTQTEQFEYQTDVEGDINNRATSTLRSSMIGDELKVGYIWEERDDAILPDGTVNTAYIKPNPPTENVAYNNFYSNNFLFLSEANKTSEPLSSYLFLELYKAMQWIRYNGISIVSLCKIINIVCPKGLVTIDRIETSSDGKLVTVYYNYNSKSSADLKQQRLSLLLFILSTKFTRVNFVEVV